MSDLWLFPFIVIELTVFRSFSVRGTYETIKYKSFLLVPFS